MANSIRVNSGAKKIEVNDNGEYILLPLGSDSFIRDFYNLMKYIKGESEKFQENGIDDITEESIDSIVGISDTVFEKVEKLLGDGTCQKVFGDCKPGIGMFMEFFDALVPFIEEYQEAQNAKLSKYNAGRTGSV